MENNTISNYSETVLLKDKQWSIIDGELCRIIYFNAISAIKRGKIINDDISRPYASIGCECGKRKTKITVFITHKIDFIHLWSIFEERGDGQDEEVLFCYSKKHYKTMFSLFSKGLPKLWLRICPKGAYEILINPDSRPDLYGMARFKAIEPIIELKPDVME